MKKLLYWCLPTFTVCWVLLACAGSLQFTVYYDGDEGLKKEDPVLWNQQEIGKVQSVKQNPQGRLAVGLKIGRDFREKVTDESRFLIQADPQHYWQKHIEMINLAEGGEPLPNDAEVEGSTYLSLQVERGSRGLAAWSQLLQQELERWQKELNQLPEEEWYQELERQMDYWLSEMAQAGVETRRYFRKEVLPRLEEAVRELKRRLRELRKEKDADNLEIKLEELKRI
jgi:paraquat-inducible protein B